MKNSNHHYFRLLHIIGHCNDPDLQPAAFHYVTSMVLVHNLHDNPETQKSIQESHCRHHISKQLVFCSGGICTPSYISTQSRLFTIK